MMMLSAKPIRLLVCAFALAAPALAQLPPDEANSLAQRFRPFIRTTGGEPSHPANWQWFLAHSTMVGGYVSESCHTDVDIHVAVGTADPWPDGTEIAYAVDFAKKPELLIAPRGADMRRHDDASTPHYGAYDGFGPYALHLDSDEGRAGEPWNDVVNSGHGIYAHVERVLDSDHMPTRLVNIEYSILWAYNFAQCSMHNGDITTMTLVYDEAADLLTRVTYSIHGGSLESFGLARPASISTVRLEGRDGNDKAQWISAARVDPAASRQYQSGDHFGESDPYVFLARDPASLLYEHPVAFAEKGSHELWPNSTGSVLAAPEHNGDGFSFLPVMLQVLGTPQAPRSGHEPFLFYTGLFGTDPHSIMMHNTWYWPQGRDKNPYGLEPGEFTDVDPYQALGNLAWPPEPEYDGGPVTLHVGHVPSSVPMPVSMSAVIGDPSRPFPDFMSALSFVPCGGIVSVNAGTYSVSKILSRRCGTPTAGRGITVRSSGGTVTLKALQ